MRIGELAKRTGLSRDTIRFYEREGLIASEKPPEATNSYRDYPEVLVERLGMIIEARDAGFSVGELGELVMYMEHLNEGDFDADDFLDIKIAKLKHTIAQAQKLLGLLQQTKHAIAGGPVEWR